MERGGERWREVERGGERHTDTGTDTHIQTHTDTDTSTGTQTDTDAHTSSLFSFQIQDVLVSFMVQSCAWVWKASRVRDVIRANRPLTSQHEPPDPRHVCVHTIPVIRGGGKGC